MKLKNNERKLLSNPILNSLDSFSSDTLKTAMRSLQHTYWVMAEAKEMKDKIQMTSAAMGFKNVNMNTIFNNMRQTLENLSDKLHT